MGQLVGVLVIISAHLVPLSVKANPTRKTIYFKNSFYLAFYFSALRLSCIVNGLLFPLFRQLVVIFADFRVFRTINRWKP